MHQIRVQCSTYLVHVDDGGHHVGVHRVHMHAQHRAIGVFSVIIIIQ